MSPDDVTFINNELLPEMVYDHCFSEPNSREFVDYESSHVDTCQEKNQEFGKKGKSKIYLTTALVTFSGEPREFSVIVKLLPLDTSFFSGNLEYFQNEEIFYNKMVKNYGTVDFPKCYVSNMGMYGRPVIVLENLLDQGYQTKQILSDEELKFSIGKIAKFHGTGLRLKKDKPAAFKEYYIKFFVQDDKNAEDKKFNALATRFLEALSSEKLADNIKNSLQPNPENISKNERNSSLDTIIHGNYISQNVFFKYENGKIVDMKIANFEFMSFNSIGYDIINILLQNEKYEILSNSEKMEELLSFYVENLNREFSDFTIDDAKSECNFALLSFSEAAKV